MPDISTARRRSYSSEAMLKRRADILAHARALITETGGDDFSLSELAKRAGVAITTIYGAFGDKEGVITSAIEEFHLSLGPPPSRRTPDLHALLRGVERAADRILAYPAYCRVISDLYVARAAKGGLHAMLKGMNDALCRSWLEHRAQAGELVEGLSIDTVLWEVSNALWSTVRDWASGRLADEDLQDGMKLSLLLVLSGATKGRSRTQVLKCLTACRCAAEDRRRAATAPSSAI